MKTLPWFMATDSAESLRRREMPAVTRHHVSSFLEQGYVVVERSIDPVLCDKVVAGFRDLERANPDKFARFLDDKGHYPRLVNLHLALPKLLELFSGNETVLSICDTLFGAETVLYTSLFYERGSAQDIHRDTPYFTTRPEYRYFGIWVALEDVDETNGPLCVVPGGHLMPELDREALALEHFGALDQIPSDAPNLWEAYQKEVFARCAKLGLRVKNVPVRKGDTIIWHPQLPHGGAAIQDITRSRFSFVMHVTPPQTAVYHHQAFFNPQRPLPETAPWDYMQFGGRRYANHKTVSFAHQQDFAPHEFKHLTVPIAAAG